MRLGWAILALLAVLMLSGCSGSSPLGDVLEGPMQVVVRVGQERADGLPLEDATVSLVWAKGELTRVTDQNGEARFDINRTTKFFLEGSKTGWTNEPFEVPVAQPVPNLFHYAIALYHEEITFSWNETWDGPVEPHHSKYSGQGPPDWKAKSPLFSADAKVDEQYVRRIIVLDVTATWDNAIAEYGDFGIGVGNVAEAAPPFFQDTERDSPQPGTYSERVHLYGLALIEQGFRGNTTLAVGPGTGAPLVTLDELPVHMRLYAKFTSLPDEEFRPVPGLGLLALLAAVACAGVLVRKRAAT